MGSLEDMVEEEMRGQDRQCWVNDESVTERVTGRHIIPGLSISLSTHLNSRRKSSSSLLLSSEDVSFCSLLYDLP